MGPPVVPNGATIAAASSYRSGTGTIARYGPVVADETPEPRGMREHLKSALVDAHDHLADAMDSRKKAHTVGLLDRFESDIAPLLAPIVERILEDPDTPGHLVALLNQVGTPEHFSSSLLIGIAVGAILAPVLGAATAPEVQVLANNAWAKVPSRPLSPEILTAAALKDVTTTFSKGAEAERSGLDSKMFDVMVEAAGNGPGPGEALLLLRRGQISHDHFLSMLRYSNLNPKFYGDIELLKYAPPTVSEVVAGAVEGHLEKEEARAKAEDAGLDPREFDWILDTAGRPPGAEQLLHLLNRKKLTEPEVRAAIRESNIKNKYIDAIIETAVYLPPPRSIVPMLRHDAITESEARSLLDDYGVTPAMQDAFVKEAKHSSTSSAKELSQSQVIQGYTARLLDRGTAQARLADLGYPPTDVALLLDLADERRHLQILNSVTNAIGRRYVSHKLARVDAGNALGAAGVPAAAQADLFELWDVERDALAPDLTVAQWQGCLRRGLVTRASFDLAMSRFGYTAGEGDLLAGLAFPPPAKAKAPAAKHLTAAQITKMYEGGQLTHADAVRELVALGYVADDANDLLALAGPTTTSADRQLTVAQEVKLFKAGEITASELAARFATLGYDATEVRDLLTLAGA